MNIKSVYIGSWFPKTNIHLKELELFLKNNVVAEGLDLIEGKKLHRKLSAHHTVTHTNKDGLKHLHAECGSYGFTYYGDGLLVVKKPAVDVEKDMKEIVTFYREKLSPTLAYLYSRGAKGLEIIRQPGSKKTIFLNSEGNTNTEIRHFFRSLGEEVHAVHNYKESSAFYTDNFILLNCSKKNSHKLCDHIISHLILFNEVKKHSNRLLEMHRYVWDEADRIISESKVRVKDLPKYNEILTDFSNMIDNISSRIDQMKLNFEYRESKAQENEHIYEKLWPNFENLQQNLDYIKNLFTMTHQHLQNNINHISSIYQENQENALNKLQLLFLLSVTTGFASLGGYIMQDPTIPNEITNNFIGFHFPTLLRFGGIAFLGTIVIYYLWNYTFKNVKTKLKK